MTIDSGGPMTMDVRSEIENAIYRFAHGFDLDDFELFADSLVEDATFVFSDDYPRWPDPPASEHAPNGRAEGREAICAHFKLLRERSREKGMQPRHFVVNTLIEQVSDDEATAVSSFISSLGGEGSVEIQNTGTYFDRLVRRDGRWRIAQREVSRSDTGRHSGVQSTRRPAT